MASSASAQPNPSATTDRADLVWARMKVAIASSSGFQSWQKEQQQSRSLDEKNVDAQVCEYLRETLETLAY